MRQFFQCSDCAKHFTEMASTPEALAVSSHREAVLWMWRAHNQASTYTITDSVLGLGFASNSAKP